LSSGAGKTPVTGRNRFFFMAEQRPSHIFRASGGPSADLALDAAVILLVEFFSKFSKPRRAYLYEAETGTAS
jgi:hypothetical protein